MSVGLKMCDSVNESVVPGPFRRSVMVSGKFQDAVVVP